MALIKQFTHMPKDSNRVHEGVECGYMTFESGGSRYLQLDTYGSMERKIPGKVSQSVQLDEQSASELRRLIQRAFPHLQ